MRFFEVGILGKQMSRMRITIGFWRRTGLTIAGLVFSGLDSSVALEAEAEFAAAGHAVVSNSSAYRQADDVPLLIPEVNPEHLDLLPIQRGRTGGGYIVTNPNCSTIGLALALAPLHEAFGVKRLVVTTLQAINGGATFFNSGS